MTGRPLTAEPLNEDRAPVQDWSRAEAILSTNTSVWVATVRPNGDPHVMPVLPVWLDGAIWFSTSHASQQTKNLTATPRAVVTVRDDVIELIVEGTAEHVTDDATLQRVADRYAGQQGWQVEVRDGAFESDQKAPTAGEMPFHVFAIRPTRAFGLPVDGSFTPTRWLF